MVIHAGVPAPWYPSVTFSPQSAAALTFPAVGAFLVFHRPRLNMAWLMCAGGLAGGVSDFALALSYRLAAGGHLVQAGYARLPGQVGWAVCGAMLAMLLPLYSPDGRLPSRRWRPVAWLVAAVLVLYLLRLLLRPAPDPSTVPYRAVIPNPLQVPALAPYLGAVTAVSVTGLYVAMALAALSLAVRMRRAGPVGRRQIGWPLLAFTGYVVFLALSMLTPGLLWTAIAWAALVPVAVAISVMRYRLFGIDTVISRAFVAAGLVAVVSAVYFGVGGLSGLVVSGYDEMAGVAAALFAGLFFQPLRRLLQRAVDRMLYGAVGDPGVLAGRLVHAVRRGDPARALTSVVSVLRDGLAVEGVAVEVAGGEPRHVESGSVGREPREVPLVWHGQRVGRLLVGPPGARRFPAAHNERVLATLAPYAADVAHAVRMAADLQRSRERIVTTREEERRRLRRDLHDGLGQTLSAMAMTITMARRSLPGSPESADELLRRMHAGMSAVTDDIRELVHGLRPPALDELGLAGAVRELAGRPPPGVAAETPVEARAEAPVDVRAETPADVRVEVRVEGSLEDLPAAVEVAVYRIVQEALTNVRKHAEASRARVVLRREASALRLVVGDDGRGLPAAYSAGVGLGSMRERAAELGGVCVVSGAPGEGTRVEVTLPLAGGRRRP
ncbi:sensor histidine kinase [Nonomuraea rhodomycinica]|uniref:Oxygen sensor histidine kinase NreB n=2 Tax=Nonomuraea rhodomycinica TaxID=1712872 RepID=A0A7Y6IYI1_9ACTN|nr:sensor histidine kinase [Nonomuraea rhodomycinica]